MPEKIQAIGICDFCLGQIPPDLGNWTSKGTPRLHCSLVCRQTANSRIGNPIRVEKIRQAIQRGEWIRPDTITKPDPANISAGVSNARKAEVAAETWRNPGLTDEARAINSMPHKHSGPLASAIEKLGAGSRMADLTTDEQEHYRAWRRQLRRNRRSEANQSSRKRYQQRQAQLTLEQKEA